MATQGDWDRFAALDSIYIDSIDGCIYRCADPATAIESRSPWCDENSLDRIIPIDRVLKICRLSKSSPADWLTTAS